MAIKIKISHDSNSSLSIGPGTKSFGKEVYANKENKGNRVALRDKILLPP